MRIPGFELATFGFIIENFSPRLGGRQIPTMVCFHGNLVGRYLPILNFAFRSEHLISERQQIKGDLRADSFPPKVIPRPTKRRALKTLPSEPLDCMGTNPKLYGNVNPAYRAWKVTSFVIRTMLLRTSVTSPPGALNQTLKSLSRSKNVIPYIRFNFLSLFGVLCSFCAGTLVSVLVCA